MFLSSINNVNNQALYKQVQQIQKYNCAKNNNNCYNDKYVKSNKGTIMFGTNKYNILGDMLKKFVEEFDINNKTLNVFKTNLADLQKESPDEYKLIEHAKTSIAETSFNIDSSYLDIKGNPQKYISQTLDFIGPKDDKLGYCKAMFDLNGEIMDFTFNIF